MNKRTFVKGALLSVTILGSAHAHAQSVRTGIDVSAEAEATTNPYMDEEESGWAGAGSVEVRPWYVRETATDRISAEAFARGRAFTNGINLEDTLGASLGVLHRSGPRRTFVGQAQVLSTSARTNFSRFNQGGFGSDPFSPGVPSLLEPIGQPGQPLQPGNGVTPIGNFDPGFGLGGIILPPLDDITIVGLRQRATSLSTSAGMNQQLDSLSSLNATLGYNRLWVAGEEASGYDDVSLGLGYSRTISPRTSVGISARAGQARYDNDFPKTTTLSAYVTGQHQISSRWTVSGSLGVSSSQSDGNQLVPEINQVGLVGSISTCRLEERSQLCANLSRSQLPSSIGRVQTSDSINLTYNERFSSRDRIQVYVDYGRSSAPEDVDIGFERVEIASVGTSFTRTFDRRFEGYVFGRAYRTYGGFSEDPNISLGIGIRARFGDQR